MISDGQFRSDTPKSYRRAGLLVRVFAERCLKWCTRFRFGREMMPSRRTPAIRFELRRVYGKNRTLNRHWTPPQMAKAASHQLACGRTQRIVVMCARAHLGPLLIGRLPEWAERARVGTGKSTSSRHREQGWSLGWSIGRFKAPRQILAQNRREDRAFRKMIA